MKTTVPNYTPPATVKDYMGRDCKVPRPPRGTIAAAQIVAGYPVELIRVNKREFHCIYGLQSPGMCRDLEHATRIHSSNLAHALTLEGHA